MSRRSSPKPKRSPLEQVQPQKTPEPVKQLRLQVAQQASDLRCDGGAGSLTKHVKDSAIQVHPGALVGLGVREGSLVLVRRERAELAPELPLHFFARISSWAKLEPRQARLQLLSCGSSSTAISASSNFSSSSGPSTPNPKTPKTPLHPTPSSSSPAPKSAAEHYLTPIKGRDQGKESPDLQVVSPSPKKGFSFSPGSPSSRSSKARLQPGDPAQLLGSHIVLYPLPQLMFPATRVVVQIMGPVKSFDESPQPCSPSTESRTQTWNRTAQLHFTQCLRGRAVFRGMTFGFSLMGHRELLRVVGVDPSVPRPQANLPSVYRIGDHCNVEFLSSDPAACEGSGEIDLRKEDNQNFKSETSAPGDAAERRGWFRHIGGLQSEIEQIHRHLHGCLHETQIFSRLGLAPPRGLILFGPPGTGKTLLARSVGNRFDASFHVINGADVVGRYLGESEQRLRAVFAEARRHQPAIIFIDEVDAIAGAPVSGTSGRSGSDSGQRRLLTCLMDCLDALQEPQADGKVCRVAVMVSTNRVQDLDTSIRRPGRLDTELEIGIPDREARRDILGKLLRLEPRGTEQKHSETAVEDTGLEEEGTEEEDVVDVTVSELADLAGRTHGYVGADLKALCQEAGLLAVREAFLREQDDPGSTQEVLPKLNYPLLLSALGRVGPSAMREVALEVPDVRWEDVGGMEQVKNTLREAVEWPLQSPEVFSRMGIRPPKGILLYGPPGCSKTMLAKAIANECEQNFLAVRGPELFSKWVGDSEKALAAVFQRAQLCSPAIIFFDEIDSIAAARSSGGGGGGGEVVSDRVLSQLLVELDGLKPLKQVTVIAATNRPDVLDPALLRPGRIDRCVYVHPPDRDSCLAILKLRLAKIPSLANDVTAEAILELLEGMFGKLSGAEIVSLCREASYRALERDADRVELQDFQTAVDHSTPRISPEQLKWYEEFSLT